MADLQIKSLHKAFGDTPVLHGVDLDIRDGEFLVFVGPSGCGKSTLLRCIAGLEEITSGELYIGGSKVNEVPPSKRGIAMVFQNYALYPHMTVAENMAFGLRLAGVPKADREMAVQRAAQILQIENLLDRMPKALSGGQRQRVAIGRAIVRKPGVFLFDEPLSNLDAALRVQMRVELAQLHDELKTTMIYVTHDQTEAMTLADRIVVINRGRIEQIGAPLELYHRPANCFVATFIGSPKMNLLPAELVSATVTAAKVRLTDGVEVEVAADATALAPGAKVSVGLRPEHLHPGPLGAAHPIPVRVKVAERLGDRTFLHVALEGMRAGLVVAADAGNPLGAGDEAGLAFAPGKAFLFDEKGQTLPALA